MLSRPLQALRPATIPRNDYLRTRASRSTLRHQHVQRATYVTISDPAHLHTASTISLAHPKDPLNQPGPSQSQTSTPSPAPSSPPLPSRPSPAESSDSNVTNAGPSQSAETFVPTRYVYPPPDPDAHLPLPHTHIPSQYHVNPPFNTHQLFAKLETCFPSPIALNLMRVTRALLVDRIGRVKRDALTVQDLESQAYLFRAALSELRTEIGVLTRNETAAMRSATSALRREVDTLDGRMREEIAQLKHEIQMDVDSRKNESKDDMKHVELQIEEVLSKALVTIGELKTQVEESRWEKMRAAVGALGLLTLCIIVSMEIYVVKPKRPKPATSSESPAPEILPPGGGSQPWVI
ncbi:hypothetical protein C2E23DRAFT_776676 [Lenzites betulinus]|nr:hypothetical protein C2E23DRAFT_776676 [Lenzites betulinus]